MPSGLGVRLSRKGRSRRLGAGALAAGVLLFGGCKAVPQAEYQAAIDENTELRERVASLQEKVRQANDQADALAQEKSALEGEVENLRSQGGPALASASGFEGIPGVTVGAAPSGGVVVAVEGDVLFDSGSADLKTDAKRSLERVAGVIQQRYTNQVVRVEGYTDTDPIRKSKWKSNEHLSAERALAVEKYLVEKGIDNHRIYAAAFGPAQPRSSKKESRRVEIVILASGG